MMARVAVSRESLAVGEAVFLAAFGVLAWYVERRKGRQRAGWPFLFAGLPGVYLASLPSFVGATRWLYVPGLGLVMLSVFLQIAGWRQERANWLRERANENADPPGPDRSL